MQALFGLIFSFPIVLTGKKHNTEKPIDDSKPTSINVNNNERGRIADSLLKEMQKHKLYNT